METNNENNSEFRYTYSAKEQVEIKKIREKYLQKENEQEDKMTRLRRLDAKVTQKAQTVALILGVVGALILGTGMSLFMSNLGVSIGLTTSVAMAVGIPVGVVGGVIAAIAYPVYLLIVKHERKKIAPEILRLTDELMK